MMRSPFGHRNDHRLARLLTIISLVAAFVTLGLISPAAHAASSYYVATNGSNSNPGTFNLPWATLAHAASQVTAGDTVYVRGGTYTPTTATIISTSGTANARITFRSYPGETAIINASAQPASTDGIAMTGSYIDIIGFEVKNAKRIGINVWGGSNIRIRNNVVHGSWEGAIFAGYTDLTTTHTIEADGNTAYNNALKNSPADTSGQGTGNWPAIIYSMRASNIRFTNNHVYENFGEGLDFILTDGGVMEGNVVHDNYSANIYLDNAKNVIVQKNLVYTTNKTQFYRFSQPSPSIQVAIETYPGILVQSENVTVRNNILIGGRYNFIYGNYQAGGGLRNTVVANNTMVKATEAALHLDGSSGHTNVLFANNIFDQTGGGNQMNNSWNGNAGYSAFTFRHNLWYGASEGKISGPGDVNADPRLVNRGGIKAADYRLQSNSPAINAGATLSSVTNDYFGTNRPVGSAYDIGAHEFGGTPAPTSTTGPTSTPAPTSTTGPTSTPAPTRTPAPTSTPSASTCRVTYTVNDWGSGFASDITIANTGTTAINGWTLTFTFGGDQTLTKYWNGKGSQSGKNVTITNESWNGSIAAGGKVTGVGFEGKYTTSNAGPTNFKLNGVACTTN